MLSMYKYEFPRAKENRYCSELEEGDDAAVRPLLSPGNQKVLYVGQKHAHVKSRKGLVSMSLVGRERKDRKKKHG